MDAVFYWFSKIWILSFTNSLKYGFFILLFNLNTDSVFIILVKYGFCVLLIYQKCILFCVNINHLRVHVVCCFQQYPYFARVQFNNAAVCASKQKIARDLRTCLLNVNMVWWITSCFWVLRPAQLRVWICVQNSWEMGVGQASFLFHISQQFLPVLEGMSVEKSKLKWGRFHLTFKNRW